ncbi:MAG: arsenic resistance N-acetyltransferase ArsN2 [Gemmatimonadota bacterium]|nr:arsenic resistance N-acetyltransferase ArsN2 [Gemmatimonadota bacterium]
MSLAADFEFSLARPGDVPAVCELVRDAGLPDSGLDELRETLIVARTGDTVVGSAALELYAPAALLRSVAVRTAYRGTGLGATLTQRSLWLAKERGIERVYLLTETAATFFTRFGFRVIGRSAVDPAVRQSEEFTTLCPESAQAMVLDVH